MPRCVEPMTPRTPRESHHEPLCLPTLDGNDGLKLKEKLVSIVEGQYDALHNELETQHDLLLAEIDKLLTASFESAVQKPDVPESDTSEVSKSLLVTPVSGHSQVTGHGTLPDVSMCAMTQSERSRNINHDASASQVQETPSSLHKLEAQVSEVARSTLPPWITARVANCFERFNRFFRTARDFNRVKEKMNNDVEAGEGLFKKAGGGKFDGAIGIIIIANSIILAIQLQLQGYDAGVQIGVRPQYEHAFDMNLFYFVLEHVFNAIFLLELIVRLYIFRTGFFVDLSNFFDMGLVLMTSVELYILNPLKTSVGGNVGFLRLVRLMKLVRVLRMVRVLKLFRSLRILLQTIAASMQALMWSGLLIVFIILMSGIFMCQMLLPVITDDSKDESARTWAWQFYGSSTRATYTMFEATLSGCWPNYARPLVENFSPWYAVIFLLYIVGVHFAVVRIVTAIFLRETLMVASNDADIMVQESLHRKSNYVEKLKAFFSAADRSGDGLIDYEEFTSILDNHQVKSWLSCLEIEVHESQALFHLLDDGDGFITYDEFLKGALRLKGHARSIDIVAIMHDMARLQKKIENLQILVLASMPKSGRAWAASKLDGCSATEHKQDLKSGDSSATDAIHASTA